MYPDFVIHVELPRVAGFDTEWLKSQLFDAALHDYLTEWYEPEPNLSWRQTIIDAKNKCVSELEYAKQTFEITGRGFKFLYKNDGSDEFAEVSDSGRFMWVRSEAGSNVLNPIVFSLHSRAYTNLLRDENYYPVDYNNMDKLKYLADTFRHMKVHIEGETSQNNIYNKESPCTSRDM